MGRRIIRIIEAHRELLVKHYEFYRSLASGWRLPVTREQIRFVRVAKKELPPDTIHEQAWIALRDLLVHSNVSEEEIVRNGFTHSVSIANPSISSKSIKPKTRKPNVKVLPTQVAELEDNDESVQDLGGQEENGTDKEIDLSEFSEYGEGMPSPGWYTDEGWRRMHPRDRRDSK